MAHMVGCLSVAVAANYNRVIGILESDFISCMQFLVSMHLCFHEIIIKTYIYRGSLISTNFGTLNKSYYVVSRYNNTVNTQYEIFHEITDA